MMKLKYIESMKVNYMILMLSLVYMRSNGVLISEFLTKRLNTKIFSEIEILKNHKLFINKS